jgi:ribosomal protein L37AE/L43A
VTGSIIGRQAQPHRCAHPTALTSGYRFGDVWQCNDCGATWVGRNCTDRGFMLPVFTRETWGERRKRLKAARKAAKS